MIYIQNKKAWKDFVKSKQDDDEFPEDSPKEYPLYVQESVASWNYQFCAYEYVYADDLKSMIDKIEKGREF